MLLGYPKPHLFEANVGWEQCYQRYYSAKLKTLKSFFWESFIRNKNPVMIYSHSRRSKCVRLTGTRKEVFWSMFTLLCHAKCHQEPPSFIKDVKYAKGNEQHNFKLNNRSTQEWFHFRKPVKGIVHPKMKIWCLSAYPKGIQDVGVSSVEHKRRFLTQIVAVCQSYNGSQWYPRLWEKKKTYTDKTKLNPAARDDTLRSKDMKRSVCARNWTIFISFFYLWSATRSNCPELIL